MNDSISLFFCATMGTAPKSWHIVLRVSAFRWSQGNFERDIVVDIESVEMRTKVSETYVEEVRRSGLSAQQDKLGPGCTI